jgi:hypothetical protein
VTALGQPLRIVWLPEFRPHKTANYRVADPERNSDLLHGDPESLIWRWARRKTLGVANMLHALLRPGVIGAGSASQRPGATQIVKLTLTIAQ